MRAGQERTEVEGALHTSCTIEMVNLSKRYDVAVIDEIQVRPRAAVHPLLLAGGVHDG